MNDETRIYKVVTEDQWETLKHTESWSGAPVDLADGFIHFSTGGQLAETLAKHFTGQEGLWLLEVPTDRCGDELRWEVSRKNETFPHLYKDMKTDWISNRWPLSLKQDGTHQLPF